MSWCLHLSGADSLHAYPKRKRGVRDGLAGKRTLVIPDVDAFPGHIACSSLSRSEIVVPLMKEGEVWGVLDIDSELLGMFDEIDKEYLEQLCGYL